jgi:hypothetical protein
MVEHHFNRTFEVGQGARLVLEHGDGNVWITPSDEATLEAEIHYRAEAVRGQAPEFRVEADQRPNEVRIAGRWQRTSAQPFALRELENRYTIRAPRHLELEINGEDGDIRIQDWSGRVTIWTKDGAVEIRGIESPSLKIRMGDGDLRLTRARVQEIDVRSEDADLDLELLRQDGLACRIRGADGQVRVRVEAGSSVRFSVSTGDGGIRVDHPEATDVSRSGGRVSGRIGGGAGRLEVVTDDGAVVLEGLGR